jgi:hypothetical protein
MDLIRASLRQEYSFQLTPAPFAASYSRGSEVTVTTIICLACVVLVLSLILVLRSPVTRKPVTHSRERRARPHGPRAIGLN